MKKIRKKIGFLRKSTFIVAIFAGAFVSTSVFFAFHPNPVYWILPLLNTICTQVESVDALYTQCTSLISYTILASFIFGALLIYIRIRQKKKWIIGLTYYLSGWITGFILTSFLWTYLFSI